jgi:hypothetical protein
LYSGTISSGTTLSGLGYILNSNGLLFQNAGGTAITQITASTGAFLTTSATIGNWSVNSSAISRAGVANTSGNISLNSSGNISVSASNVASYTAGINGPWVSSGSTLSDNISTNTQVGVENVFWAGTGGPTGTTENAFRVTLGGNLYASNALITGTVQSSGTGSTGNRIIVDGANDLISILASGSTYGSYIISRNGNLYITGANSTSSPFSSGTLIPTSGPTNAPYFAAGGSFKTPWSSTELASGIGLYTGAWDYSSGTSDPFITLTKNSVGKGGIQLSASPAIGMIIEKGGMTGDAFTTPTVLIYTATDSSAGYKPSLTYGSWATFQSGAIVLSANSSTYVGIYGSTSSTSPNTVVLRGSAGRVDISGVAFIANGSSAYAGAAQISLNPTYGVQISGIPVQKDADMTVQTGGTSPPSGNYAGKSPLGPYPRQRMLVEDPVSGMVSLGMAVYYRDTGTFGSGTPTNNSGYAGDLWVDY